jgi:hypothetical protein
VDPQIASYLAYFLVLAVLLRLRTPALRSPWFFFFRSAFPNWKFYHCPGDIPHLYARVGQLDLDGGIVWAGWQHCYPRRQRQWLDLLHNPHTNLAHVRQSLVDHFHADLYELEEHVDPRTLVSYRLIEAWLRMALRESCPDAVCWQFELRMQRTSAEGVIASETMMISPVERWS